MSFTFDNDSVLAMMEKLIKNSENKNEDFKAGISYVKDIFQNLIYAPNELSDKMKNLALTRYLNNDESKLNEFANFIDLFVISMQKIGRYDTWWEHGPNDCEKSIFELFQKCFDGVNITNYSTDFTKRERDISLVLRWTLPNGDKASKYANKYSGSWNDDDEYDDNISNAYRTLLNNIDVEPHFETLMFHICLEKLYPYLNHEKVKEELKKIRQ